MSSTQKQLNKAFLQEQKSFFGFFIKNYRFTYLIIFAVIALGFFFLTTMPREADPEIKVPFASVVTVYPGANPGDVEELVTNKLEDKIKDLDNLNKFSSTSGLGFSSIFVEFQAEAEIADSMQKLRDAVDLAKSDIAKDAEDPMVREINITDIPIVTYSLVGDYNNIQLKNYADILEQELKGINSVSKVNILGAATQEIQIIVDQTSLVNFNINLSQIVNAIRSNNINLPLGEIEIDNLKYNVRAQGKTINPDNLGDIVIATYLETPIYLKDIAQIKNTQRKQTTKSRIGIGREPPRNTISLQVHKKTGGNILTIVGDSQEVIQKMRNENKIPQDLQIIKTNDNAVFIKKDISTLGSSGIQTMFFIVLILFIAIGFRSSIITSLSVPIAFLMAFIFLNSQEMTLNGMVLFSLVLSLGLMVDNSIVIIEGINEYSKKYGLSMYKSAILSVWNYKWPIIAGTMTTISAFLPMLLVSGIMGQYLSIMPITISSTLFSSLFVALVIIPTLSHRFIKSPRQNNFHNSHSHSHHLCLKNSSKYLDTLQDFSNKSDANLNATCKNYFVAKPKNPKKDDIDENADHSIKIIRKLKVKYEKLLRNILPSKLKRRLSMATAWILFIAAVAVPAKGLMPIEMFGQVDVDYFVINVELPVGSSLEDTSKITSLVEEKINNLQELENFVTNIGTSASIGLTNGEGGDGSHLASITVNLVDTRERKRTSFEITQATRAQFKTFNQAKVTIEEMSAGPPTGAPVEVRITGDSQNELAGTMKDIKKILSQITGVINIKDNLESSPGEFTFSFDQTKMNYYGLTTSNVAGTIRTALYGTKAGEMIQNGDDIEIRVKYSDDDFKNINDLEKIILPTQRGENITLSQIAKVKIEPALLSVRHKDGDNVIIVRADIETGTDLAKVLETFHAKVAKLNLPSSLKVETGGEVEDIDKSFRETFLSMIVAVMLIAIILVLIFNSFRQPFIVIFALPLGIIGVIFGLLILGMPFSFTAFIGIVALSGIVVNDSIVLIDRINKNRTAGLQCLEAIVEAGMARMQPILLTSLTTIAGIFPLIYASELWRGFSIAVIFGLMFSTVLMLVIIPIMFASMCGKKR